MRKIFILEDNSERCKLFRKELEGCSLTIIDNAKDAIECLKKGLEYDVLFLDHDLGDRVYVEVTEENTGSTVATFLSDKKVKGKIIIHSYNPVGAKHMLDLLPKAIYIPFSESLLRNIGKSLK